MAEIAKLSLTFKHNVKQEDVSTINDLTETLKKLNDVKFDKGSLANLTQVGNALKSFKGISINKGLGDGVSGLIDAANRITGVKDITSYATNMRTAFKVLRDATKPFEGGKSTTINKNLGLGITGIVDATNKITTVKDITSQANNIKTGFNILGSASESFNEVSNTIPRSLGSGISGIVDAINKIDQVKDISLKADNLRTGFHVLGYVAREFNQVKGTIPVNLGRGITGIVDAINKIDEVKDIGSKSEELRRGAMTLSVAIRYFDELNTGDYSGIAKLVTALASINNVKKINDNVIKNAEKLSRAINVLDKNTSASTPRLKELNSVAKNLGTSFHSASGGAKSFSKSLRLINVAVTIRAFRTVTNAAKNMIMALYSTVEAYGEVENTMSFFGQSLGSEAKSTAAVIQSYANTGAIEFARFGDQVAKLNQIYRGYGIESKQAAEMALSLTQLAYDASYALGENGKDMAVWEQRAVALATGQTRSGYYFGVDTSVKALNESFDEMSSQSVKADRAVAALNVTLQNTTAIQQQMGREYMSTYVQVDVLKNKFNQLKQSLGRSLLPAFGAIIKAGIIAIYVVERLFNAISNLFGLGGFKLIDYEGMVDGVGSGVGDIANNAEKVADGMAGANKQAKELKKTITGIDQVFTINDMKPSDTGGVGVGDVGGGSIPWGGGYDWTELLDNAGYMDNLEKSADKVWAAIKRIGLAAGVTGGAILAIKFAKTFMDGLKWINGTKDIFGGLGLDKLALPAGMLMLAGDLNKLRIAIKEFFEEPSIQTGGALFSSFVGSIGSTLVMFGQTKFGGALKVVQGLSDIVLSIKSMVDEGVNWDDVNKLLVGLSDVAIGIGLIKKDWATVGVGLAMQGALAIIDEFKEIKNAIETGDWSNVDKLTLFIGAIQFFGGIAIAIAKFNNVAKPQEKSFKEAIPTTKSLSDSTGGVSTKMVDMAKNIGMGILILAEVAAAALIFVGAIWAVGKGLEQVGLAWEPVIANANNIIGGITLGTILLTAIGGATYALGTIAIGGVGTVPLAIAAGTGMLLLLAGATKLFIASLTSVAKQLTKQLAPELDKLNAQMPTLNTGMKNFTNFMIKFAGQFVLYSASSAVSGISATISTVVGWFTRDPIKKMASDVKKNGKQLKDLNNQFEITNPQIERGSRYMNDYERLLKQLVSTSERASNIGSPTSISADFKTFSKNIKTAFDDLGKVKTQNVTKIMSALNTLDLNKFKGIGTSISKSMELGINDYKYNINKSKTNLKKALSFSGYSIGTDIAKGVQNGINGWYPNVTTFTNRLKNNMRVSFEIRSPSRWARDVVGANIGEGVEVGINKFNPDFGLFRHNVENELEDISMPTFDTQAINDNLNGVSRDLSARVQSQFNYTNDGTQRAIEILTQVTSDKLERVAQEVERGQVIEIDGDKIGETSDKYIKNKAVRNNVVFGR